LLSDLERLTDDAALAIETATKLSTQLDEESSDDLRQVTSEVRFQYTFISLKNDFRE